MAARLQGVRATARCRHSTRKQLRRADTSRRPRVPGGPKGLLLVRSSRGREARSWVRDRYISTTQGGSPGDTSWTKVLQ